MGNKLNFKKDGWLPKVKKAVPVSDRVLRSQVANKLVARLDFD